MSTRTFARLMSLEHGRALVRSDTGEVELSASLLPEQSKPGDWLAVEGDLASPERLTLAARAAISPGAWIEVDQAERAFLLDPSRRRTVELRARLVAFVRRYLEQRGYLEVVTPVLHSQPEACQVNQLTTTGANGSTLYLRTDPEEYLKRYLTAGFAAVYEISTNIRGEHVDATHLQEFTSVEGYERGASFEDIQSLVADLIGAVLEHLTGERVATYLGATQSFVTAPPVEEFDDLLARHASIRPSQHPGEALANEVRRVFRYEGSGGQLDQYRRTWLEWLFDTHVAPKITRPTFVTGYPVELGLSGRARDGDSSTAYRGELYLAGGFELAHYYENIHEVEELRRRYEYRLDHRIASGLAPVPLDEGLQTSAALGMPPMSGFAIGIDRLLMVATGSSNVAGGLLFPHEGFNRGSA